MSTHRFIHAGGDSFDRPLYLRNRFVRTVFYLASRFLDDLAKPSREILYSIVTCGLNVSYFLYLLIEYLYLSAHRVFHANGDCVNRLLYLRNRLVRAFFYLASRFLNDRGKMSGEFLDGLAARRLNILDFRHLFSENFKLAVD